MVELPTDCRAPSPQPLDTHGVQAKLEAYPELVEGLRHRPAGMRALRF